MGDPLPPHPAIAEFRRPHGTVLLLNFNVDEREMYRHALVAAGYEVIVCVDPYDVLAVAARRPDALVTRILQPNCSMDGIELIRHVRLDSPSSAMRIIVTASLVENSRLDEARDAGCDECLLLPSSPQVVVEVLRRALADTGLHRSA
jgi:CheY-like chemotaxis protein